MTSGRRQVAEPLHSEVGAVLHPSWSAFVRYCEKLRYGEIERLKIQDGLPVVAEVTKKKVKFS